MSFKCVVIVGSCITLCVLIAIIIMMSVLKTTITSASVNKHERFHKTQKIPRIIHQTGPDSIPKQFKKGINKLKHMNPEYEYKFWSNSDIDKYIDKNCSKRERDAYKKINPLYGPARADFFRYIIVRDQGGVYLDLKSRTAKPLRKIIKPTDEYLLSCWISKPAAGTDIGNLLWNDILHTGFGEYCNWFIIAAPKHPFLDAVIKKCIDNIEHYQEYPDADLRRRYDWPVHVVSKLGVLHITGPIAYTKAILPIINTAPHTFKYAHYDGDLIYTTTPGKLPGEYLKHADYFVNHYSTITKPIIL